MRYFEWSDVFDRIGRNYSCQITWKAIHTVRIFGDYFMKFTVFFKTRIQSPHHGPEHHLRIYFFYIIKMSSFLRLIIRAKRNQMNSTLRFFCSSTIAMNEWQLAQYFQWYTHFQVFARITIKATASPKSMLFFMIFYFILWVIFDFCLQKKKTFFSNKT